MTPTHARWRILPVHLVAKLFGVLIKVEGLPFGSNRTHLANPPRREDIVGGQVTQQGGACASNAPPPDRDRDALALLLTQVITNSSATAGLDLTAAAETAANAFCAGLAAFKAQAEPLPGTGTKTALSKPDFAGSRIAGGPLELTDPKDPSSAEPQPAQRCARHSHSPSRQ